MITFCVVVSPLPHAVRKRLFTFLSESPIVGKIAYGLKISFMYVHKSCNCGVCANHWPSASWRFSLSMRSNACSGLPQRQLRPSLLEVPQRMTSAQRPTLRHGSSSTSLSYLLRSLLGTNELQCAAEYVPDRIRPLPLACAHADVLHQPRPHPCTRGVRQAQEAS